MSIYDRVRTPSGYYQQHHGGDGFDAMRDAAVARLIRNPEHLTHAHRPEVAAAAGAIATATTWEAYTAAWDAWHQAIRAAQGL